MVHRRENYLIIFIYIKIFLISFLHQQMWLAIAWFVFLSPVFHDAK